MRVLFGIILGVALTVGVAFISDTWTTGPATTTGSGSAVVEHRQMVNWDVVGDNMRIAQRTRSRGVDQAFAQGRELTAAPTTRKMKTGPIAGPFSCPSFDLIVLALAIELAFFRHALEGLAGALDPILMFIAFRRQQLHDLERAARAETAKWTGCVADVLTDRIFVNFQQRSLPSHADSTTPHTASIFHECPFTNYSS